MPADECRAVSMLRVRRAGILPCPARFSNPGCSEAWAPALCADLGKHTAASLLLL